MFETIINTTAACETYRTFSKPPFRFGDYLLPDKIVFNPELAIYLVWIEGKPVLHIVDTHTHFQNAIPIRSKRV